MSGTTGVFVPSGSLAVRDPTTNEQMNGNIVNPPRYCEFGGLSGAKRGLMRNDMKIVRPGASTRQEPVS